MELSDEQKQRILEEEQARLAEERYREQVRLELKSKTGTAPSASRTASTLKYVLVGLGVAVVLCVGILIGVRRQSVVESTPGPSSAVSSTQTKGTEKPSPLPPPKLTTAEIADRATRSVVIVENFNEDGEKAGQGSGYVYANTGIIITNYHVVRGATSLTVRGPSKESLRVESILGYSIENDVAALQVSASLPILESEILEPVKVGDRVVAIGAPLGLESTVSEGIVSALRDAGGTHIIQTTASISPGSSGGPLLDEYGKVIGLTTATVRDGQNLNFVISIRHVSELLDRKREMALSDVLSETEVTDRLPGSTLAVPAHNAARLNINVPGQQGAVLEGTYTVNGGTGNDVDVALVTSDNRVIFNSGRVKAYGQVKQRLPRGIYALIFNNGFSTFSSKSVSPDLTLRYYK